MTNQYYECHVTMVGDPVELRPYVESMKWKFSAIDGDPVLGEGVKCYATRQFKGTSDKESVLIKLRQAAWLLENEGFEVIRRKVELVLYDDRSSKVAFECNGGCPECHTEDLGG